MTPDPGTSAVGQLRSHLATSLSGNPAWDLALSRLARGEAALHLAVLTEPFCSLLLDEAKTSTDPTVLAIAGPIGSGQRPLPQQASAAHPENAVPDRFTSIIDVHVILRRAGKILLLRRAGNVYASGQLCLPSGHLEKGENILQAAIRETKEETGIVLDPATLRLALSIHQRNPEIAHTRIGFAFEPGHWQGEPVIGEPTKCSQLVWADPGGLPSDTVQYTAAIIRAIQDGTTFTLNGW